MQGRYKHSKVVKPSSIYTTLKNNHQPKKHNSSGFSFTCIRLLTQTKITLESLPSHNDYQIEHEVDFARKMSEVLPFFKTIRLEQV